jgi:tetratricopeptide (TPR) repeat protein
MTPRPLEPEPDSSPFDHSLQLAAEGRYEEAVRGLLRSLGGEALHPQHRAAASGALARIARLAEAVGDVASAERALAEAVRISPGYADLHYRHACALLLVRDAAGARRALETALRLNPRYVAARVERALLDAREGRLGESLDALRRLGEDHRVGDARAFRRGLESLEHADWDEAGGLIRHALQLGTPGTEEVAQQFHQLLGRGDRAGARRLLLDALAEHEGFADLHFLLGTAELEEDHLDDAVSSLARALELHPDFHAARVQLARALEALGDVTQAAEQVALVLERDPGHPLALQLQERWRRVPTGRRRTRGETPRAP